MSGATLNALLFLISSIFNIYIFILLMRVILAWTGADYAQPIVQFIVRATRLIITPMRKILPDVYRIELSTIVFILVLEMIKFFLIFILSFGFPNIFGLFILAVGDSIKLLLELLFYSIFIQWIIQLIQPNAPIVLVLTRLTYPIMGPLRKIIPPIAGIDWSFIPALILLQLLIIVAVNPLLALGLGIAVG